MPSVVIADDHQMFIDGIKVLLSTEEEISIIGEALNGEELLVLLEKKIPDIILMDISMPVLDGIEATKIIRRKYPEIKILMLTMYNTKYYITSMIAAGVNGYLLKNAGKEELLCAIETVQEGANYYSQDVTLKVIESYRGKDTTTGAEPKLTRREKEVLQLVVNGLSTDEIAEKLFLSPNTVAAHRKNMVSKFQVHNLIELAKLAIEKNLLD